MRQGDGPRRRPRRVALQIGKTMCQRSVLIGNPRQVADSEQQYAGTLSRIFALAEAYPELKASEPIRQLFEELTSTENRVTFARQAFNDGVTSYNIYRKTFPAILLAPALGHATDASLLEIDDPELFKQTPRVQLS